MKNYQIVSFLLIFGIWAALSITLKVIGYIDLSWWVVLIPLGLQNASLLIILITLPYGDDHGTNH